MKINQINAKNIISIFTSDHLLNSFKKQKKKNKGLRQSGNVEKF